VEPLHPAARHARGGQLKTIMSQLFHIHPENPQARLIREAVKIIQQGGVIAYPTDSCYALGCHLGDKRAMERILAIRQLDLRHHLTLVCRDLSELGSYARVDNAQYRLLKAITPGAYTFILQATKEVPRRTLHPKRNTIGLRVPDHPVALALLEALGEPLLSCTLMLPHEPMPPSDPFEIRDLLQSQLDLVIDGGYCGIEPTTVLDLTDGAPQLIRAGAGPLDKLGLA
jgi:tRNA threonylcarbamoyl adenosine modification protein (Sua5/YciO/YrdC/YwlC family)